MRGATPFQTTFDPPPLSLQQGRERPAAAQSV